jgi:hypothetical protein
MPSDRSGHRGDKSPNQHRERCEESDRRRRFPGGIRRLPGLGFDVLGFCDDIVDPLFGIGLAGPCPRRNELGEVGFVRCRYVAVP